MTIPIKHDVHDKLFFPDHKHHLHPIGHRLGLNLDILKKPHIINAPDLLSSRFWIEWITNLERNPPQNGRLFNTLVPDHLNFPYGPFSRLSPSRKNSFEKE